MEIPPAPLCQGGVRAGFPLRKRGVRGDLLQHANQSCHDSDSPLDFETVSSCLSTILTGKRLPVHETPATQQAPYQKSSDRLENSLSSVNHLSLTSTAGTVSGDLPERRYRLCRRPLSP